MAVNLSSALAAYSNAAARAAAPGIPAREGPDASFGSMVQNLLQDAVATGETGERVSGDAMLGRADLTEVVLAVGNAETTLQTVVGIRDRVIAAYQDIMRMPI